MPAGDNAGPLRDAHHETLMQQRRGGRHTIGPPTPHQPARSRPCAPADEAVAISDAASGRPTSALDAEQPLDPMPVRAAQDVRSNDFCV